LLILAILFSSTDRTLKKKDLRLGKRQWIEVELIAEVFLGEDFAFGKTPEMTELKKAPA
jgi:hypothetical protein